MTGSNWQADMLNRLNDGSSASGDATATPAVEPASAPAGQPVPEQLSPPEPDQQYPLSQYPPPQQPVGQFQQRPYGPGPQQPVMAPPPPPPSGAGWGAAVPPQEQQPQYDQGQQYQGQQYQGQYGSSAPQYPQYPQYQQPPVQQYEQPPYGAVPQVPATPYEQPFDPQYAQQGPPPQYAPGPSYGPPPSYPPAQYPNQQPPYEQPVYQQPQYQPLTGWDNPSPDGGPGAHAYTPAYQDPLAGPLPVASGSVGLQHEERGGSGGFLRRIGRLAAEAAYIAGASGRMQRDVENIAIIRRPIGIGRMIGIIGPIPQSGTSTVAALLADALASQRTDIVLAVDAFPREGK
ncbi:MAG: hypothetical protein QOH50_4394, partial [Kribbellaceae bacterium]|nr:hypothetical protein [Kribbellaceae bacterium]